jgi:hypothetical protein
MASFEESDFLGFEFGSSTYNLNFTDAFEQINDCLEEQTENAFHTISDIMTKETSNRTPYLYLLKKHSIYGRISEFLLNFTSPDESRELYDRLDSHYLPSRFTYESKLAEIKWYLKSNRVDNINRPLKFILEHLNKWLGDTHPLFTQINRALATFFSDNQFYYTKALNFANASLEMQKKIFNGDH